MLRAQAQRLAVLIPAYRPSDSLVDVVRALVEHSFPHIVVVDDGSGPEFAGTFRLVAAMPGVELLRHATNMGKGAALKTGINHILCTIPDLAGVVTADADGQHHPDDIARVGEGLLKHPDSLVLGSREFRGEVPLRSRVGNVATSAIMHALMGRKIADTQTGLRGIPAAFAPRLLKLEANGYEFELEMLLTAHKWEVPLTEVTIRTIYQPGNPSSHFNPVVDSMKIYFILLRFGSISFFTALLDNLLFILARHQGGSVLVSQILGRTAGLTFNYIMVRNSVFFSRQRHRSVLPKYLLLSLVSGALSYGGIRLLAARAGIDPVPAKLLVESLLFVVNFAVQRLFIFKPGVPRSKGVPDAEPPSPRSVPSGLIALVVTLIFAVALAMEAHGFSTGGLFAQDVWEPVGAKRFLKFIGMFLGISTPFLMMAPWSFAALIAGLTAIGTVVSVGPMPLVAVAFYLISSCALGSRLLGRKHGDALEEQLLATLLGAAVWIALMFAMVRLPVNYPAVWAGLLAIPVLLDWRGARQRLMRWRQLLTRAELRGYAERTAFAMVVFVLLAHWFVALMPELSADGLAMHLAIPANIAANHAMTYQPGRMVWSVMPMGADFSYTIVYLLGGEYAAHLLDYALLLMFSAILYFVMRKWIGRTAALLLLALFASTPLVQLVTGSLFVENVLAALIVGMMAALWRFGASGEKRFLFLFAMLAGTAMATKFGALAFVLLALPFIVVEVSRHWKALGPRPALVCGLAAVVLLAAAVPTYALAYSKTGDPLFPFLADKFHSPLIPANAGLVDERFKRPLNWDTPFDLTFHSHLTYEGRDGSFGFQYLLLAPLAAAAILLVRRRDATRIAVSAAVVSLGAAAIVMSTQPNARYLYAALPLLSVPFAALLGSLAGVRWLYRLLLEFVVACLILNVRFLPSASYYHRDFCLRLPFSMAERDRYRAAQVPVREVIAYFNRTHPDTAVMMSRDSTIAGLNGEVYENHWHQINNLLRIRDTATVPAMVALMQSWNVHYFISPKPESGSEIQPAAFREMLERCTETEFEAGDQYLSHLQTTCRPPRERVALLVHPGTYDDFHPALLFRGDWTRDNGFDGPDRHTISYTDIPGSEVEILFEGTALTYVYTKAPNRGIASVTVDGVEQGSVDLYSTRIEWQSRTRFCCYTAGRHVAVVKLTGRADSHSSGRFIDLDSFIVE